MTVNHSFQCCTYSARNPTTNELETFNYDNEDVCQELFHYLTDNNVAVVPWLLLNGKEYRVIDDPCDAYFYSGQRVSVRTGRNKWENAMVYYVVPDTDCQWFAIRNDKDDYDDVLWVHNVKATALRAHHAIGATAQYRANENEDWSEATITNAYSMGLYDIECEDQCVGNVDGEDDFRQWWSTSTVNRCAELTCPFALSDWTGAPRSTNLEATIYKNMFKGKHLKLNDLNQQHECESMKRHMENLGKANSTGGYSRFDFEDSLDMQSQKDGANPIYRATSPACLECWRLHHFSRELKVVLAEGVKTELYPVKALDDLPMNRRRGAVTLSSIYVARSAGSNFWEGNCMKKKVTTKREKENMITVYFKDVPPTMAWKGCTGACMFKLYNANVSPINEHTIIASDNGQSCTDACAATSSDWTGVHEGETMMCIQGNKNNAESTVGDAVE